MWSLPASSHRSTAPAPVRPPLSHSRFAFALQGCMARPPLASKDVGDITSMGTRLEALFPLFSLFCFPCLPSVPFLPRPLSSPLSLLSLPLPVSFPSHYPSVARSETPVSSLPGLQALLLLVPLFRFTPEPSFLHTLGSLPTLARSQAPQLDGFGQEIGRAHV